jgi:ribosomal protein S18 acetylase RimI-like enzyme
MIEIVDIQKEKIHRIRNLWEKLNKMHYEDSIYFEDQYEAFSFTERIEPLIKINEEDIKISIINNMNSIQGYCISSIDNQKGEIDSIYIDEDLRGRGLGKELINNHIKWMKERGCSKIKVAVSFGHDSVIDFYHKLGFYERLVYYELKDIK